MAPWPDWGEQRIMRPPIHCAQHLTHGRLGTLVPNRGVDCRGMLDGMQSLGAVLALKRHGGPQAERHIGMTADQRHRQRDELLAMTERLVAEYAGVIPAGSVMRTVARCQHAHQLRCGDRDEIVVAVEGATRTRLAEIVPAHRVA